MDVKFQPYPTARFPLLGNTILAPYISTDTMQTVLRRIVSNVDAKCNTTTTIAMNQYNCYTLNIRDNQTTYEGRVRIVVYHYSDIRCAIEIHTLSRPPQNMFTQNLMVRTMLNQLIDSLEGSRRCPSSELNEALLKRQSNTDHVFDIGIVAK